MNSQVDPRRLPVMAFAQAAGHYKGTQPLSTFSRLMLETGGVGGSNPVEFEFSGELIADAAGHREPWIHLQAKVSLPQTCQRCLGPVEIKIQLKRDFRFVASEALAEVEDEESEEDVLVISRAFDALSLVEDEVLMGMPSVPMHDVCPNALRLEAKDPDFDADLETKPNPFAVLRARPRDTDS
jgi:uncharacterized protein